MIISNMAKNKFLGLTNRVLLVIVAAMLVLSYVSIVINPAKLWVMSIIGTFFIPLALVNVVLLVWAVFRKSKAFLIPLVALLPSLFFVGRFVRVGNQVNEEETGESIKIMTWNVGRFRMQIGNGVDSVEECVDSVFNFIRQESPDIVCLQEMRVSSASRIKASLNKRLKGYSCEYYMFPDSKGAFGNVIFSRLPVVDRGRMNFEESTNLAIYADYRSGDKVFRVYNCHFESYNISFSGILRGIIDGEDEDIVSETGHKMRNSIRRRPHQVDQVFDNIEECDLASFVCGDFNDTPISYTYYRLLQGRKDTFAKAGTGFSATYTPLWPILRLDYILCPESCEVLSHKTPHTKMSDHYPVIAEIQL